MKMEKIIKEIQSMSGIIGVIGILYMFKSLYAELNEDNLKPQNDIIQKLKESMLR